MYHFFPFVNVHILTYILSSQPPRKKLVLRIEGDAW